MYKDITLGFEFEVDGDYYAICDLIDNSSHITGITEHCVNSYHETRYRTAYGKWRIEDDESIDGAEFISPPFEYYKAKKICKEFFEAIDHTRGIGTTEDCGLHVGMSVNGDLENVNLETLIPSINYRLLATLWPNRALKRHPYCKSLEYVLKTIDISNCKKNKEVGISDLNRKFFDKTHSFIKKKKYNHKEYLEIRVPGGYAYHLEFDNLFVTINHIANILLGYTKITKKQVNKKMYSYLNRAYLKNYKVICEMPKSIETIKQPKPNMTVINREYKYIVNIFTSASWYGESDLALEFKKLNTNNYIYYIIKSIIAGNRDSMLEKLQYISDNVNRYMTVAIPEKEPQSDMVKMLKMWPILPKKLVVNLIERLNQRAYHHFIDYYINRTRDTVKTKWITKTCEDIGYAHL